MDDNIIDDATFDRWAVELKELQDANPDLVHKGYMPAMFENWTGDTGMHLPITDEMYSLAEWLLANKR